MTKLYYVSRHDGLCGISDAPKAEIIRHLGTDIVRSITPATNDQIEWVRAMGGYLPDSALKRIGRQSD